MERKKAIVTGASRGIGKGIALSLAQADYDLAISYHSLREEAEAFAHELQVNYGGTCHVFQTDFSEINAAEKFISEAVSALGGLDLLVNNAAVPLQGGNLLELDGELVTKLINANFRSVVLASKAAARSMVHRHTQGCIINISSVRAERAFPEAGIYCGIKAAINQSTRCFALDLAPYGIRINTIEPGATLVRTNEDWIQAGCTPEEIEIKNALSAKIPLGRMGMPSDIGNAVLFLASDQASYITGAELRIDGGLILPGMPEDRGDINSTDRGWGFVSMRDIENI